MAPSAKDHNVRSSLPYQIILYLNGWYFGLFFLLELGIFIYKGITLPYPSGGVLAAEIILLFILAGLEAIRLFFGQKGNLTERSLSVILSILFTVPSLFGCLYLLLWQTYVLRVEVILIAIELALMAFELIFGIVSVIVFARGPAY